MISIILIIAIAFGINAGVNNANLPRWVVDDNNSSRCTDKDAVFDIAGWKNKITFEASEADVNPNVVNFR